ncbi:hypothetical protein E3U43_021208 [Larimichthys crocea]|uniref:Uncharacterized protein n=1 Tax=Larimichthys crocea TaxID=215358 RepID=A0ACD3R707_LARCR|nr:hypothetical protein E3U43_021208 [Larimichthys crocea]
MTLTYTGRKKERYRKNNGKRERERQMEVVFFKRLYGVSNILSCWMFSLSKEEIFCENPWWSVTLPTCYVQLNLRRKMRRYLQTIYMCGRLLSVSSSTKERKNKKDVLMILEFCVVRFFVTITISMSFF